MKSLILASGIVVLMGLAAHAQAVGTLRIQGNLTGSIVLAVIQNTGGGAMLVGSGTTAATLGLGTFSAATPDGQAPSGLTKGISDATGFSLSTSFSMNVTAANGTSATYNMAASIDNTDQFTYYVNGFQMSTSPVTILMNAPYGSNQTFPIAIRVPATASSQTIHRIVTFTATAN